METVEQREKRRKKARMRKKVGLGMETDWWEVEGLVLYDGLFYFAQFYICRETNL